MDGTSQICTLEGPPAFPPFFLQLATFTSTGHGAEARESLEFEV